MANKVTRVRKINCRNKQCAIVCCKIVKIKAPISQRVRGYRLVAAVPNRSQYHRPTDSLVQSFHPRFYVAWQGDWTKSPSKEWIADFERAVRRFPINAQQVNWF